MEFLSKISTFTNRGNGTEIELTARQQDELSPAELLDYTRQENLYKKGILVDKRLSQIIKSRMGIDQAPSKCPNLWIKKNSILSKVRWVMHILIVLYVAYILPVRVAFEEEETWGKIVLDHSVIAWEYITSWFLIDFCTAIPFSLLGAIFGIDTTSNVLKVSKLLKIVIVPKTISARENVDFLARLTEGNFTAQGRSWVYRWDTNLNNTGDLYEEALSSRYLISIYWAITTLSTVGYGDISPREPLEIFWAVIMMVTGSVVFAWMAGSMATELQKMDDLALETDRRKRALEALFSGARSRIPASFTRAEGLDTKKIEKAHSLLKNHNEENRIIPHLTVRQVITEVTDHLTKEIEDQLFGKPSSNNPNHPDSPDKLGRLDTQKRMVKTRKGLISQRALVRKATEKWYEDECDIALNDGIIGKICTRCCVCLSDHHLDHLDFGEEEGSDFTPVPPLGLEFKMWTELQDKGFERFVKMLKLELVPRVLQNNHRLAYYQTGPQTVTFVRSGTVVETMFDRDSAATDKHLLSQSKKSSVLKRPILKRGSVIGDIEVVLELPWHAKLTVDRPARVFQVPADVFLRLVKQNDPVSMNYGNKVKQSGQQDYHSNESKHHKKHHKKMEKSLATTLVHMMMLKARRNNIPVRSPSEDLASLRKMTALTGLEEDSKSTLFEKEETQAGSTGSLSTAGEGRVLPKGVRSGHRRRGTAKGSIGEGSQGEFSESLTEFQL